MPRGKGSMRMGVGNPKTRRGKMAFFAKGGITYKDPDIGDSSAEARELGTEAIKSTARERDIMESAKGVPSLKEARPKTRGEAFKLARANKQKTFEWPPGSGNMYHTRTAEEEAARKPAAAPKTEAPKPEAPRAAAPSSAALLKARNEANVARERELMRNRKQPTATNAVRAVTQRAAETVKANRASTSPAIRMRQAEADTAAAKKAPSRSVYSMLHPVRGMDVPDVPYNPSAYERQLNLDPNIRAITGMGMAKGGSVNYSKMEREHVRQMKKHGVPEKYVKQEEKEAKGMKRGGMACGGMKKYAKGGMVRADGVAQRGKTKCKIC